tara:strand:- start:5 stop:163 length:159 start_codon:yes stop_codon:yes gene_type:complete
MKKKDLKRQEAEERNARWANLTPEEQIAHLDTHNLTATRQRAKIARIIGKKR